MLASSIPSNEIIMFWLGWPKTGVGLTKMLVLFFSKNVFLISNIQNTYIPGFFNFLKVP